MGDKAGVTLEDDQIIAAFERANPGWRLEFDTEVEWPRIVHAMSYEHVPGFGVRMWRADESRPSFVIGIAGSVEEALQTAERLVFVNMGWTQRLEHFESEERYEH